MILSLFLENMFDGKPAEESFNNSVGWWSEVELKKNYVYDHNKKIGIASHEGSGTVTVTHTVNGVKTVEKRMSKTLRELKKILIS